MAELTTSGLPAQHLQAAAKHLRQASARYTYGPKTLEVLEVIDDFGDGYWDVVEVDSNQIARNLDVMERELARTREKGAR